MAVAVALVLALGLSAGAIRLMPWLVAKDVPLSLAAPFARVLASSSLEASVLVGVPLGVALATASFVDRGEARALAALGASPARLVGELAVALALLSVSFAPSARLSEVNALGALSNRLVAEGRRSCAESESPRRVDVPLVALTWLCFERGARIVGRVPGFGDGAWFSASDLAPSADFGTVTLSDLHLSARLGSRIATVHAGTSRLSGLPRWGTSRSFGGVARALLVALSASLAALGLAVAILRRRLSSQVHAAALAALSSVAVLSVLLRLDRDRAAAVAYVGLPVLALVLPPLLAKIPWNLPWIARSERR